MLRSLLLILCLAVMPPAAVAQTQVPAVARSVIADLQAQGYGEIEITRTFLGRLRIVAEGPLGEREIVLNPRTGVILRDTFYREDDDDDEDVIVSDPATAAAGEQLRRLFFERDSSGAGGSDGVGVRRECAAGQDRFVEEIVYFRAPYAFAYSAVENTWGLTNHLATVVLTPDGDGTKIAYEVNASVGGKLAQLGSRIIDSFSKKMADQFFQRFQAVVEGTDGEEEVEVSQEKKGWLARLRGA